MSLQRALELEREIKRQVLNRHRDEERSTLRRLEEEAEKPERHDEEN